MWHEKGTVCHFLITLIDVLATLTSRTSLMRIWLVGWLVGYVAKLKQDIQLLKIFGEAVVTLASRTSLMRIWLAGRQAGYVG